MSISQINKYSNSMASIWGMSVSLSDESSNGSAKITPESQSAQKSSNAYNTSTISASALASALGETLDELGLSSRDKISFQALQDYRDKLQTSFTDDVKKGLLKAGVDKDIEFRIAPGLDGTGVRVISDHPDKAKVEKFFQDNPELVSKFEKIQSLSKLEETRKRQGIDIKAIRDRIQLESMTAWYAQGDSFASFSAQGAAYYSGINTIA